MKAILHALLVACISVAALAECQINVDPSQLPTGHTTVRITGCMSSFAGQPLGCWDAVVSLGGVPFMYQAVFQSDAMIGPGMWTSFTLHFECNGQQITSVYLVEPYQTICSEYPWNPPPLTIVFPGIDPELDCNQAAPLGTNEPPITFELGAAFPNPFNPGTTIHFVLPTTGQVKLDVYSITSQKVATLVDGMMDRGTHEVSFDGTTHASGVYMYTLKTGGFTATGKMLLVK